MRTRGRRVVSWSELVFRPRGDDLCPSPKTHDVQPLEQNERSSSRRGDSYHSSAWRPSPLVVGSHS